MSGELTNILQNKSYLCVINSADKIYGTNNNATYQINWNDFLPRDYEAYKLGFSAQTSGMNVKDTSSTFTITSIVGNTMNVNWVSGMICAGQQIVTNNASTTISGSFNATISGNLMTISGAVTNYICGGATLTSSGTLTGAVISGSITGTTLTVATAAVGFNLVPGVVIAGSTITSGTTILSQLTGSGGGIGTYLVSISQTAASTSITATYNYNITGSTITGLQSGTQNTSNAVYTISNSYNQLPSPITITSSYNFSLGTTYIVSGTALSSSGSGSFVISNSFYIPGPAIGSSGSVVYSGARLTSNLLGRSYSFDTSNKGATYTLGVLQRDIQTASSSSNSYSAFYLNFPPKTMSRPNQNLITINFYNSFNNQLLTDTSTTGVPSTDMAPYTLMLEFTPINESFNRIQTY